MILTIEQEQRIDDLVAPIKHLLVCEECGTQFSINDSLCPICGFPTEHITVRGKLKEIRDNVLDIYLEEQL